MRRTLADARRWTQQGTKLVAGELAGLDEAAFAEPSALPGWSRKHLVAHLAANADAIGNLAHWAATGERTPMYSSPEQRNSDIESGGQLTGADLTGWFARSADDLDSAMDALTDEQWGAEVVTAQGRTVPASETAWMRAREVMVHAVDLATGTGFDQLPDDFLLALCDDVVAKRNLTAGPARPGPAVTVEVGQTGERWSLAGAGEPVLVTGSLGSLTAYLAGRRADGLHAPAAGGVPPLPSWL
jgi:maleylpyruvate isomerase